MPQVLGPLSLLGMLQHWDRVPARACVPGRNFSPALRAQPDPHEQQEPGPLRSPSLSLAAPPGTPGGQDSRQSPGLLPLTPPGPPACQVPECPWVKAATGRGAAPCSPAQERSPRRLRERRRQRRPCCGAAAAAPSRNSGLSSPSRSSVPQTWDFLGKSSAAAQERQARPRDARPARRLLLLLLCPRRPPGASAGRSSAYKEKVFSLKQ
ncbi:uncharacterized protein LOC144578694 isoform X2 [Callithrix jacchus]